MPTIGQSKMAEKDPSSLGKAYGTQSTNQLHAEPSAPPPYEELFGQQTGPKPTKCSVHSFEDVTMFCEDHQELCCNMCFCEQNLHRFCPGIKYIVEAIRGRSVSTEFHHAMAQIRRKQHEVDMVKNVKLQSNYAMDQALANIVSAGQTLQQRIGEKVDALKREAGSDIARCDAFVMDIAMQMQMMGISDSRDEVRMFVDLQRANQKIRGADLLMRQLSDPNNRCNDLKQFLDADIKQFLTSIDDLDKVTRMGLHPSATPICRPLMPDLPEVDHEYEVIHRQPCILQFAGVDERRYEIKACSQLANGLLLMADHCNRRVILVNPDSYAVIDHCKLSKAPLSLCSFGESSAVITLDSFLGDVIVFFEVQNNLIKNVRYVEVEIGVIKDVIHLDNEFYCLTDSVKVANVHGKLLRKIKFKPELYISKRIAVSPDASRLYITGTFANDYDLLTIDKHGEVLATLKDPRLKDAYDVCVDRAGNVFLTGKSSNNVCQISRCGSTVLRELATAADGIASPKAICFDQYNSALIVANSGKKGRGELHVFKLK